MLSNLQIHTVNITGSTVVNHKIRCALELSLEEYTFMDFVYQYNLKQKNVVFTVNLFLKAIGFTKEEITITLEKLDQKKLIIRENKTLQTSPIWNRLFDTALDFDNEDKNSPGLWQIFNKKGNKQTAKTRYIQCVKIIDTAILKAAAIAYMKSVDHREEEHKKGCDVWLNPKKRHWEDKLIIKEKMKEVRPDVMPGQFIKTKVLQDER